MLTAYFDESGHSASVGFVSIAAFIADDQTWEEIGQRWTAALKEHEAPPLHTTDLANFKKAFSDWDDNRRRALMASLLDALQHSGRVVAVGATLALDDWNMLPPRHRQRLRDPYFVLFQETVRGAALEARFRRDRTRVRMVFSRQEEFGGAARELWSLLREVSDVRHHMGELEFADMKAEPGLQAADLLAFELRRYYQNRRARPDLGVRYTFRQILIQQRAVGVTGLQYLPLWMLRLHCGPSWLFKLVMGLRVLAVAPVGLFTDRVFLWALNSPVLTAAEERVLDSLVRADKWEQVKARLAGWWFRTPS